MQALIMEIRGGPRSRVELFELGVRSLVAGHPCHGGIENKKMVAAGRLIVMDLRQRIHTGHGP